MKQSLRIVSFLILLFSFTPHALAYNLQSSFWGAGDIPVEYWVSLDLTGGGTTSAEIASAQAAADTWSNDAYAQISLDYQGTNSDYEYYSNNGIVTVMSIFGGAPFPPSNPSYYRCQVYASGGYVLGFNFGWYNSSTGEKLDSQVVICGDVYNNNTGQLQTLNWYTGSGNPAWNQSDLRSVVAHEIGHLLGLLHSCDFTANNSIPDCNDTNTPAVLNEATMRSSIPLGSTYLRDINADDIGGLQARYGEIDNDGDGYSVPEGDCDDNEGDNFPGNTEIEDGIDNDCDDLIDEGFDIDNDGFSIGNGDCDDNDPSRFPGQTEVCDDGIDQDCDGSDEACPVEEEEEEEDPEPEEEPEEDPEENEPEDESEEPSENAEENSNTDTEEADPNEAVSSEENADSQRETQNENESVDADGEAVDDGGNASTGCSLNPLAKPDLTILTLLFFLNVLLFQRLRVRC